MTLFLRARVSSNFRQLCFPYVCWQIRNSHNIQEEFDEFSKSFATYMAIYISNIFLMIEQNVATMLAISDTHSESIIKFRSNTFPPPVYKSICTYMYTLMFELWQCNANTG